MCSRSGICVLYLERIRVPGQEYVFFIWKKYVFQDMTVCSLSGRNMCFESGRNMCSLSGRNTCSRLGMCVLYLERICVPGREYVFFL